MKESLLREPVAVVAMSCRLPGAVNPQAFWEIVIGGKSSIREVSTLWLDHEIYFDPQPGKIGKTYSKLGVIFDTINIENEIKNYRFHEQFRNRDPLLKLAYIVADEVLNDVVIHDGCDDFGVYIGGLRASDLGHDYILSVTVETVFKLLYELPEFSQLPSQIQHDIVTQCVNEARRKYRNENYWDCDSPEFRVGDFAADLRNVYGWTGAAYSLDAACASSLVAIDCARADILAGKISGALVGGISAMTRLTPILFSKNFAATPTLSRPFDANADGMVGAMGIVFVFLKSLLRAEQDGDKILGLIRGIGFSSDGRGKSLWAPRVEGELIAMKRAYRETSIVPQQLHYLEAHATSTSVGDSTELKTIENLLSCEQDDLLYGSPQLDESINNKVQSEFLYENTLSDSDKLANSVTNNNRNRHKLAIGSVKANFGHAFEAAGFVGLMKVIQICRNKIIPPQINISELHPDICNRQLPFFIPQEPVQLTESDKDTLLFGVNAFGVGGLNTHLIFEEYKKNSLLMNNQNQLQNQKVSTSVTSTPIAVLGIGCVYPRAFSLEQFRTILKQKTDPKQHLSSFGIKRRFFSGQKNGYETEIYGGFIENYLYDWTRHKIPPLQIQRCDPLHTFVMGAVDDAMSSAVIGRELSEAERDKMFVVAGSEHLTNFFYEYQQGMRSQEFGQIVRNSATTILPTSSKLFTDKFDLDDVDILLDKIARNFVKKILHENSCVSDVTGGFSSSSLASRITKLYDLHGGAFTIDGGFVSSLIAIDYSLQKLRRCGGMGICIGAYHWTNSHAFEFYRSRYGEQFFPIAEGAGAVILKPLVEVDPIKEKPFGLIYDVIRITRGKPDNSDWDALNLSISDLAFISISAPAPSKHLAILDKFFRNEKRVPPIPVTTCRDQFGNFCAGAGMAELIKIFLILQDRTIPPQFDWKCELPTDSIFFVTKNPIELNLVERSFVVLFDLDEDGNGYAAIILPFLVTENNTDIEHDIIKSRPIERQNVLRFIDEKSVGVEFPRRVYIYHQVGVNYEIGFGLGVADAVGIERLIRKYDDMQLREQFIGEIEWSGILTRALELFGESGIDELRGLSDGSGVPFEKLFMHNIRFYSGLTGTQFLLRDAGMFRHLVILEHPMCEFIGGEFDVHLSECEPASEEPYLRVTATGCVGGFAASRTEISVSILPKLQQQSQNSLGEMQLPPLSNLAQFINISSFFTKISNVANVNDKVPIPNGTQMKFHQSENLTANDSSLDTLDNPATNILIVDTLTGNFKNTIPIYEHNLTTTKKLIQKFSSSPRYLCTIMLWNGRMEIF